MVESAGYSGTPLVNKLGSKPGMRVRLVHAPSHYWKLLGGDSESPGIVVVDDDSLQEPADFTHVFAADADTLDAAFGAARSAMKVDGMVWASWPRRSSGVETEIGKSDVMEAGKRHGLVDVEADRPGPDQPLSADPDEEGPEGPE